MKSKQSEYENMEVLSVQVEVNPCMTFQELWEEANNLCPKLPYKSQFYEWMKICKISTNESRGGKKGARIFTSYHLNRIVKLYQLKEEHRSLKKAEKLLIEEMKANPDPYIKEEITDGTI